MIAEPESISATAYQQNDDRHLAATKCRSLQTHHISPPHEPLEAVMHPTRDSARRPSTQSVTGKQADRPAPVEFYRKPGVCVTSESFTVAGRRFPVVELTQLKTARGPHDPLTVRAVVVTGGVLVAIGVAFGYTGEFYRLQRRHLPGAGCRRVRPGGAGVPRAPAAPSDVRAVGALPGRDGAAVQQRPGAPVRSADPVPAPGPGGGPVRRRRRAGGRLGPRPGSRRPATTGDPRRRQLRPGRGRWPRSVRGTRPGSSPPAAVPRRSSGAT